MLGTKFAVRLGPVIFLCCIALISVATPRPAEASCLPASVQQKLGEIRQKFGPIKIVSAHRPGARVAGSGRRSYHASCRAVDFNPPRGKYKEVAAWLNQTHDGGVGTYSCGMHHIHLDNGPRVRFHKCHGGGRYAAKSRGYGRRKYAAKASSRYSWRQASGGKSRRYAKAREGNRYAQRPLRTTFYN